MVYQRGSWYAHGLCMRRPFRRDEKLIVNAILFMMFIAGFVFFVSALLLLGFGPTTAFYCFMGIFLIFESIFVSVSCYLRCCGNSSSYTSSSEESSIESVKQEESKLCSENYGSTSFFNGSITHGKADIEEG